MFQSTHCFCEVGRGDTYFKTEVLPGSTDGICIYFPFKKLMPFPRYPSLYEKTSHLTRLFAHQDVSIQYSVPALRRSSEVGSVVRSANGNDKRSPHCQNFPLFSVLVPALLEIKYCCRLKSLDQLINSRERVNQGVYLPELTITSRT